jgi:hypothetical protein
VIEEEHEVYGGDIPEEVEGELEGELDGQPENGSIKADDVVGDDAASKVYMSFPSWFICVCVCVCVCLVPKRVAFWSSVHGFETLIASWNMEILMRHVFCCGFSFFRS